MRPHDSHALGRPHVGDPAWQLHQRERGLYPQHGFAVVFSNYRATRQVPPVIKAFFAQAYGGGLKPIWWRIDIAMERYLAEELGEGTIELMRTVKQAVDPLNIMNPSKVGWLTLQRFRLLTLSQLYPDPVDKGKKTH